MWLMLALVAISAWLLSFLLKDNKDFWKKYGVVQMPFSSFKDNALIFLGKKTLGDIDETLYKSMGSLKYCGVIQMQAPILLVKDLDVAKKILIKDFDHFVDRRSFGSPKSQPIVDKMLTNLHGEEWKGVRNSVSPTFTTGKIRRMMEYFNGVGNEWVAHFKDEIKRNGGNGVVIKVERETKNFTVDVIANAVFGFGAATIKNPNSTFALMVEKLSKIDIIQTIKFGLAVNFPKVVDFFGMKLINQEGLDFFESILSQGMKSRMDGTTKRNDFLQLIAEAKRGDLKAQGSDELSTFEKEAMLKDEHLDKKNWLQDDTVAMAQLIIFFFAGFSTTSNFIGFMMYALAVNPKVQEKLREEVDKQLFKNGSEDVDYDVLNSLTYMEMCVCEGLRKFPPLSRIERKCTKEYYDSEEDLKIPKDAFVGVPVQSIHNDPKYYDHPDEFYPEHFTPENKANRNPYAYLPFGTGPRNCVGMRFALVESKAAIAHLVHNFVISPAESTPVPIQNKKVGFGVALPEGLELKFSPVRK